MNMKKILVFFSALTVFGAFTACGGEADKPAQTTQAASTAAATSAVTTAPTTTSATTTTKPDPIFLDETAGKPVPEGAVTFDTPSLYGAHAMNGGGDEAPVELAVVDFDGDKKLRVRVLHEDGQEFKVPKIVFSLPDLIGLENTGKVGHLSMDLTCLAREEWLNDDGSKSVVVGNFLGAIAGNIASEKKKDADGNLVQNDWATHVEFKYEDWDNFGHTWRCETDIPALMLESNAYADKDKGTSIVLMRWGQKNAVDFYIDNISILDKEGKPIPIVYDTAKNPAEVVKDGKESAGKLDSSVVVAGSTAASTTTAGAAEAVSAAATTTAKS